MTAVITRSQELAEQSANGVYTLKQRKALDEEAGALNKEINRIIATTEFNGRKLFATDSGPLAIQAGVGEANIHNISLTSGLAQKAGDGTFTTTTVEAGAAYFSGDVGDLNRDGNLDVLLAGTNLAVMLGRGDGTFSAASVVGAIASHDAAVRDLNGDGILDLVSASGGDLTSYLGKGDGTFDAASVKTATIVTAGGLQGLDVGDFNGDGRLDVVAARALDALAQVFWGNGDGSFAVGATYNLSAASWWVKTGDFNGDGKDDFAVTDSSATGHIFLGSNDRNMVVAPTITAFGPMNIGDIDRDGNLDLLAYTNVIYGKGDGTFGESAAVFSGMVPGSVGAADFNNDGWADLVAVQNGPGSYVGAVLNKGDGTLNPLVTSTGIAQGGGLSLGDMNNDGVNDVVAFRYWNDATPSFGLLLSDTTDSTSFERPYLLTAAGSRNALDELSRDLNRINTARSTVGAHRSRLTVGVRNLEAARENYLAAASRISDADIANESATLARQQIVQQAAASILGQANQQPAMVLKLIS